MTATKSEISFPDINDLSRLIRFQTDQGKIWLGEQRSILMTLPALAGFRREVLQSLGLERTKGFFMRLGYQNGLKDGEMARHLRPDASVVDMFLAGPQLHMLRGMVQVKPLQIEIDPETGHFFMEHLWLNSFEVEICLSEFGILEDPVCWILIGYACGYSSSALEQEIIFKEVECRGCGDEHCRAIGKPAHEWEDHETFKRYFVADPLIEELYELQSQISALRRNISGTDMLSNAVGHSKAFQQVCDMANKASHSNVSVLLYGETGVGKEVMAQGLHKHSERANEPFIAVNCAAIPPDLIEAELFGVEKGAFTGATQSRMGRFERAHKGTVFLDEVVELTPRAQASLLRVLQEGELERVGDNRTRKVDVRVLAATNEDLELAVKEGRFRADLFYRLNVFPVTIPALRERREDIPLLVEHFLDKYHARYHKKTLGLSNKAMEAVMAYDWPGNIRELGNIIERGVILTDTNDTIGVDALIIGIDESSQNVNALSSTGSLIAESDAIANQANIDASTDWSDEIFRRGIGLEEAERILIDKAMTQAKGNVSKAARLLNMTRPALAYRLSKN
ncbi:MAG: sigma-54-dependent Fis family transcriptional regulator [Pseudomonadales bacterium]|nr:sigma-54-dependent Fis family transcriptional regulator [Pseudomonadales bacterium]